MSLMQGLERFVMSVLHFLRKFGRVIIFLTFCLIGGIAFFFGGIAFFFKCLYYILSGKRKLTSVQYKTVGTIISIILMLIVVSILWDTKTSILKGGIVVMLIAFITIGVLGLGDKNENEV